MKSFKILGLLISYPNDTILSHLADMKFELEREQLLPEANLHDVSKFIDNIASKETLDLQEFYVKTFDFGRRHCLHLFEHIHGESRDRGQAMVDLGMLYESKGLEINNHELPDYLPLFLEFLSNCEMDEAQEYLKDAIQVIMMIGAKLKADNNYYYKIFDSIEAISNTKADKTTIKEVLQKMPKAEDSLEEIDKEWEEAAAFGNKPSDTSCQDCEIKASMHQQSTGIDTNIYTKNVKVTKSTSVTKNKSQA